MSSIQQSGNSKRTVPYLMAVLNATVIGISFLFIKLSLDYANPLDTLTYRFAAAFVITAILIASGVIKVSYRGKPILYLLPLAAMYPIGFFLLQTLGLQYATSAEGGIINAFTPVVIMLMASVFLKEATSLFQKCSIFVSVFGILFIVTMSGSVFDLTRGRGILLLLLACVTFAGYSVLTRSLSKHFSAMEITCFMVMTAFIGSLTHSLIFHTASGTFSQLVAPLTHGIFLALVIYLGAVQLITAMLGNYVLARLEASKAGVFTNLSTVISIAAGALILNESIEWYHLCGSVLIVIGVIGANRSKPSISKSKQYLTIRG